MGYLKWLALGAGVAGATWALWPKKKADDRCYIVKFPQPRANMHRMAYRTRAGEPHDLEADIEDYCITMDDIISEIMTHAPTRMYKDDLYRGSENLRLLLQEMLASGGEDDLRWERYLGAPTGSWDSDDQVDDIDHIEYLLDFFQLNGICPWDFYLSYPERQSTVMKHVGVEMEVMRDTDFEGKCGHYIFNICTNLGRVWSDGGHRAVSALIATIREDNLVYEIDGISQEVDTSSLSARQIATILDRMDLSVFECCVGAEMTIHELRFGFSLLPDESECRSEEAHDSFLYSIRAFKRGVIHPKLDTSITFSDIWSYEDRLRRISTNINTATMTLAATAMESMATSDRFATLFEEALQDWRDEER